MTHRSRFADLPSLVQQPPPPVTPLEVARGAAQALQTSFYQRMRRRYGGSVAARLAWMLVRTGDPDHPDCSDALAALAGFSEAEVALFAAHAEGARDSLRNAAAARLAAGVVRACGTEVSRRAAGGGVG